MIYFQYCIWSCCEKLVIHLKIICIKTDVDEKAEAINK